MASATTLAATKNLLFKVYLHSNENGPRPCGPSSLSGDLRRGRCRLRSRVGKPMRLGEPETGGWSKLVDGSRRLDRRQGRTGSAMGLGGRRRVTRRLMIGAMLGGCRRRDRSCGRARHAGRQKRKCQQHRQSEEHRRHIPKIVRTALGSNDGLLRLAGAAGFEPANAGTKNRCLTTWRRPSRRPVDAGKARL